MSLAVLGAVGLWWGGSGGAVPEAPAAPTPTVGPAAPVPALVVPAASLPVAAAAVPTLALRAASTAVPPRSDPSKFQREVQQALSSDKPGLAWPAAQHIAACIGLENMREDMRATLDQRQRAEPSPQYRDAVVGMEQFFAGCQSLDAASRAQLIPLLRRSLQEGERGAAVELARQLGQGFDPAREADAVAALRRDAWACDRGSISHLGLLARRHPQLLTPNELGAVRQMQRDNLVRLHGGGQPGMAGALDRFKPPAGAELAEVARLATGIQSHCAGEDEADR